MTKIDLKRQLRPLYHGSSRGATVVEVPAMTFLMVDGRGDPNIAPAYREAVEALYALSYTLKFMVKRGEAAIDYGVMPLEGLWWTEDMRDFDPADKGAWQWTAMIHQPAVVTHDLVEAARADLAVRKALPALEKLRFESFAEGRAAQILHIGPYAEEAPTIALLHAFIEAQGGKLGGKHHEIYLSDPRRAAPERLKTLIRQPFA